MHDFLLFCTSRGSEDLHLDLHRDIVVSGEKKISRNVFEPNKTLQFLLGLGPYSASTGGRGGGGGRGNVHNGRKKIGGGAVVSAAGGRHSADANAALR